MTRLVPGSLDPRGPYAETIGYLWWFMLALGVAVFLVFAVFLGIGLMRRPAGGERGEALSRTTRWFVGGGVVMPVVVLTAVLAATVYAMRAWPHSSDPQDAVVIEVVGHQWWYEVRYPDQDVTSRNEMHIPVGEKIVLRLSSADVIHSFWVPELGGKMDMLPGDTNVLVLQADEGGRYQGRCAEFCGLHHADMHLVVIAEPRERFTAWLAAQG